MNEPPVVHYMILCEDALFEGPGPKRLNLYGLILRLNAGGGHFPMCFPKLCAFLALRNGRGTGSGQVLGVHNDTGMIVCRSTPRTFDFGNNPLEFRGGFFRMNNTVFPAAGAYTVEFRYNGIVLAAQSFDVLGG
jgi:hypothetical protein